MGLGSWLKRVFGGGDKTSAAADDLIARAEQQSSTSQRIYREPRTHNLSGLDASKFAPLSSSDAISFIRSQGSSWKTAYLDSLSRIPSIKLPRIQVIDRAMVGLGLITPEELVEIHEVGEQMDEARPDYQRISQMAEVAVARSLEEKEAIKKQKKEEAAKKRKEHAEAVARRRATDIVFLGRNVSAGLADRRANVEKLQAARLPLLTSPADIAKALEMPIPKLRWLAYHTEASPVSHYIQFSIPKKSGGERILSAPHTEMARCQYWILENILNKIPLHDAAHGFVKGRSTVTNAAKHAGQDVVINIDLKDFFPTVTFPRIRGIFQSMGYSPAASAILALLASECPRTQLEYDGKKLHVATGPRALPQGACTSPALSNLVARKLDARLTGICRKLGWTYTRYADDMTFSAKGPYAEKIGYFLARVRHIVSDEGFAVNHKKTRVLRQSTAQTVTGIVVNDKPGVPRKQVRIIRAILHNAKRQGLGFQNRNNHPNFESWLLGMIAYINMVNPDQGRKLYADWQEVFR